MLIGQLAARTGTTVRMVRHYADAGLLASTRRDNGYRDFDEDQVVRVRQVTALLGLGLTVDQIRALQPCLGRDAGPPGCAPAKAALRRQLARITARIEDLTVLRDRIAAAVTG